MARLARIAVLVALLPLISPGYAATYSISATGGLTGGVTPVDWSIGMGFSHESSNSHTWLRYLNPTMVRLFVQPLQLTNDPTTNTFIWRDFMNSGGQWGLSFGGADAASADAWRAAVAEVRAASAAPGARAFLTWLREHGPIKWDSLFAPLLITSATPGVGQAGNPAYALKKFVAEGYKVVVMWDVRCKHLAYTSLDPAAAEYWRERWETYRLFYVGGRWLANTGVTNVELYNEPDKDVACIDGPRWVDDARIRAQALRDAYADHSAQSGKWLAPYLVGPSTATPWSASISAPLAASLQRPFPDNAPSDTWRTVDAYAFHRYGTFSQAKCTTFGPECRNSGGAGLRNTYDNVLGKLAAAGLAAMPVWLTEFNCYTAATSDNVSQPYFRRVNVADTPQTGACVAAQLASLVSRPAGPFMVSMHKFVQSYSIYQPSLIQKNGVFFATVTQAPYDVTGSTKTGEAYRLLLRRGAGGRRTWAFTSLPAINEYSRVTVFAVDDDQAYYIYCTSEDWQSHDLTLNLSALPGIDPWSQLVTTAVANATATGSSFHGEVAAWQQLGAALTVQFTQPAGSVYMLTAPKVPTYKLSVPAAWDTTLRSGAAAFSNYGRDGSLQVSTNPRAADGSAVALMRFDAAAAVPGGLGKVVTAVLQLRLQPGGGNAAPQVLTVLGMTEKWDEWSATWGLLRTLRPPPPGGVASTLANFVVWDGTAPPSVEGHVTVPPAAAVDAAGGAYLRLDVTDAVKRGVTSFAVVRLFRFDGSPGSPEAAIPGDVIEGVHVFDSKESGATERRPQLLIDYQTPPHPPPPPLPSPPPSPPPPSPPPPSPPPPDAPPPSPPPPESPPPPDSPPPLPPGPSPPPDTSVQDRNPPAGKVPPPPWWKARQPPPKKASTKKRPPPKKGVKRPPPKKGAKRPPPKRRPPPKWRWGR